jgi:hypothetical protein
MAMSNISGKVAMSDRSIPSLLIRQFSSFREGLTVSQQRCAHCQGFLNVAAIVALTCFHLPDIHGNIEITGETGQGHYQL